MGNGAVENSNKASCYRSFNHSLSFVNFIKLQYMIKQTKNAELQTFTNVSNEACTMGTSEHHRQQNPQCLLKKQMTVLSGTKRIQIFQDEKRTLYPKNTSNLIRYDRGLALHEDRHSQYRHLTLTTVRVSSEKVVKILPCQGFQCVT